MSKSAEELFSVSPEPAPCVEACADCPAFKGVEGQGVFISLAGVEQSLIDYGQGSEHARFKTVELFMRSVQDQQIPMNKHISECMEGSGVTEEQARELIYPGNAIRVFGTQMSEKLKMHKVSVPTWNAEVEAGCDGPERARMLGKKSCGFAERILSQEITDEEKSRSAEQLYVESGIAGMVKAAADRAHEFPRRLEIEQALPAMGYHGDDLEERRLLGGFQSNNFVAIGVANFEGYEGLNFYRLERFEPEVAQLFQESFLKHEEGWREIVRARREGPSMAAIFKECRAKRIPLEEHSDWYALILSQYTEVYKIGPIFYDAACRALDAGIDLKELTA